MKVFATCTALALFATPVFAQETPAPDDASVYFVNIEDGATVTSPVTVVFGLSGMGVAPAGTEKENTGHHHLLINRPPLGKGEFGAEELKLGLPSDDNTSTSAVVRPKQRWTCPPASTRCNSFSAMQATSRTPTRLSATSSRSRSANSAHR